ncbi:MAG: fibronectin type III domain-containing protein [Bacteroidales bacterium]|nr:fibronectin type III domain-containing protein [Bacteroidales bacterium]
MKKMFSFLLLMAAVVVMPAVLTSCGDDEPEIPENPENQQAIDDNIKSLSSKLFNTSWTYQYSEFYNKDNGRYSHTNSDYANKFTFTFSNEVFSNNEYRLIVNGNSNAACWWHIDENGVDYSATDYGYRFANMTAADVGGWSTCGGCIFDGYITTHTNSKLILKEFYSDGIKYVQHIYTALSNSGGGIGGSDSYEKPDVGFYDFTATKTSLKVQYKIYNKDEAGVTSAKIYYGTSGNPSSSKTATISGSLITANISGLKAGTTYYVKCVATGKGGTTTTSVTKCITNY